MNKQILSLGLISIIVLMSCQSEKKVSDAENENPNIIYILADDMGYNDLGCYGAPRIQTPNIDRMAAEGIRFTQHYAGTSVCAPSRSVLMTGQHTGHTPVRGNMQWKPYGQLPLPVAGCRICNHPDWQMGTGRGRHVGRSA